LSPTVKQKLTELGWTPERLDTKFKPGLTPWNTLKPVGGSYISEPIFQSLLDYKAVHGDCLVTKSHKDRALYQFVQDMRRTKQAGRLPTKDIRRLEKIGFSWSPFSDAFERNIEELRAFKQVYKHCNVPRSYSAELNSFVRNNRDANKKGKLPLERIAILDSLGFEWELMQGARGIGHDKHSEKL
jgi:hypothetical protein